MIRLETPRRLSDSCAKVVFRITKFRRIGRRFFQFTTLESSRFFSERLTGAQSSVRAVPPGSRPIGDPCYGEIGFVFELHLCGSGGSRGMSIARSFEDEIDLPSFSRRQ